MSTNQRRYQIGEVSHLTGFTPTALRYYERAGLLSTPERTAAGYRTYDDRAVERLRLVARAKELGCTLKEVAGLVEAWDTDDCEPVKHRLRSLVATKVAGIDHHIAEQRALATQLRATAAALAARPVDGPCDDSCGCTAATPGAGGSGCRPDAGGSTPSPKRDDTVPLPDSPTPPMNCSLPDADREARIAAWKALLGTATRDTAPGPLRLRFVTPAPLAEIVQLAEAEHACCGFFTFMITIDTRGVTLEVTAPADRQTMLQHVFATPA